MRDRYNPGTNLLDDIDDLYAVESNGEEDICCYCGGGDTDKQAAPKGLGPKRKWDSEVCHEACEEADD